MMYGNANARQMPAMLVIQNSTKVLALDSAILNSFRQVYKSVTKSIDTLVWIQQNQPALMVLNLEDLEIEELDLVTALRTDWLTRNIPILAIADKCNRFKIANLDCDRYLLKPYSALELERAICSLVSSPSCMRYAS